MSTKTKQPESRRVPSDASTSARGCGETKKARAGEPKLRFSGFLGEWNERRIEAVLNIGSGKDYKHLKVGSVPVFGTGGYMLSVDKALYSGESVLIGRKGTINKPFYYNGDFWTVDTLFYTHSFKDTTPKFISYIFQRVNWLKYNEASGVPSLSKVTIEKIKINLPSLPEQQKIASFLKIVDEWIENLRAQKEALGVYKKGMMQKIFPSKGGHVPEVCFGDGDWEEKRLGDVAEIITGTTPPTEIEEYYNGNIPWVTPTDINSDKNNNHNKIPRPPVFLGIFLIFK